MRKLRYVFVRGMNYTLFRNRQLRVWFVGLKAPFIPRPKEAWVFWRTGQLPPPEGGGLFLGYFTGNNRLVDASPSGADLPLLTCRGAATSNRFLRPVLNWSTTKPIYITPKGGSIETVTSPRRDCAFSMSLFIAKQVVECNIYFVK